MSHVLSWMVILSSCYDPDETPIAQLETWLQKEHRCPPGKWIQDECGGNKCMQLVIYGCATNYLRPSELLGYLRGLVWPGNCTVQLVWSDEHDEGCGVATVRGKPENAEMPRECSGCRCAIPPGIPFTVSELGGESSTWCPLCGVGRDEYGEKIK